jgi:hypothetical protein
MVTYYINPCEVLSKMSGKKGAKSLKGPMGRPPGGLNRSTLEVRDLVRKVCGDPIEGMARIAAGDVVALGYMTQKELDAPASFNRIGQVTSPSGKQRALEYIPVELRARLFTELAQYCYAKRKTIVLEDSQGNAISAAGSGVVFYLPQNGRDSLPQAPQ